MKNLNTTFTRTLLLTVLFTAGGTQAGQAEINQIETAVASLDVNKLRSISRDMTGYDLALAKYRTALSANLIEQKDLAGDALDESMDILEQLNQQQPDNVEVKALLAQVYGYKIALSPIKGMYYGPKALSMLAEAEKLAPKNPRVLLVKGISAANTPPMFGGDKDEAMTAFEQAIEQYAEDQYSDYHWGYAEAYTWRGVLMYKQGDKEQAQIDWQKAMEVEPGYGWAQTLINKTNG